MGLTIHYTATFRGKEQDLIDKLTRIRQYCLDMHFEEVGEINTANLTKEAWAVFSRLQQELSYPNNADENLRAADERLIKNFGVTRWDMIRAAHGPYRKGKFVDYYGKPTTLVELPLWPGEGCESSNLTFYKRGAWFVCHEFCKTQYAERFVQCHLLVVQLLDLLKAQGFYLHVYDEGGYWETRNMEILAKNINESTAMIKAVLGSLKSAAREKGMIL